MWWEQRAESHQQQHAAVLSDGSTAAQEAQHHDDDPDGDHQVDARKRLICDLVGDSESVRHTADHREID